MFREVFIYKDLPYAQNKALAGAKTALTPDDLADGACGIYAKSLADGSLKLLIDPADGAAGAGQIFSTDANVDVTTIQFAQGRADGLISFISPEIDVNDIKKLYGEEYVAPTKKAVTITPTMPAATLSSDFYFVTLTKKNVDQEKVTYEVGGKFANATAVVTALKAKIAADTESAFKDYAASGAATLIITGVDDEDFDVVVGGTSLLSTDIAVSTPIVYSKGSYAKVAALEKLVQSHRGYMNTVDGHIAINKPVLHADSSKTYDSYIMEVDPKIEVSGVEGGRAWEKYQVGFFFCDGVAGATDAQNDFKAIIDDVIPASKIVDNANTAA